MELVMDECQCQQRGDVEDLEEGTSANVGTQVASEQNRRITSIHTTALIKDERLKAEQGQASDERIEGIFNQLYDNNAEINCVESIRTLKMDSEAFDELLQYSVTRVEGLKDGTAHHLDTDRFISRLKTFSLKHHQPGDANDFATLGRHFGFLLRRVPSFHYIRPCFELKEEGPLLRAKIERKRAVRVKGESQVVRGKTLREIKEEGIEEGRQGSVNKELDNVRRHLRRIYKRNATDSMDYYRFVLNPASFGETVENMFYVSFLIKDGQVRLRIDQKNGNTSIVKISREEREQSRYGGQLSERPTTQVVPRLDYSTWERLVHTMNIDKPCITRQLK